MVLLAGSGLEGRGRVTPPRQYLVGLGEWSEDRHGALAAELEEFVRATNAEAQSHGVHSNGPHHDPGSIFEDVYKEMPWHLREQQAELARLNASAGGEGA